MAGLVGEVEELVDTVKLDALVVDLAGDDGTELKLRPGDDTGEAEAADGGGVELGILGRGTDAAGAIGADELKGGVWRPKVPAMWWFLPWMSLAMAPPSVTYLVPGETGRNQPRGTAKSRIWASVMPASAVRTPVEASKASRRFMPVVTRRLPWLRRQTSP